MRPLTQTEIDNAPDWADKFDITEQSIGDLIGYYGDNKSQFKYSRPGGSESDVHSCYKVPSCAQPIPRKKFDISEYIDSRDGHGATYFFNICSDVIGVDGFIDKGYSIALAKHFKLRAEDLK